MPRPKRKRLVESPPLIDGFKPFGIPMKDLEPAVLLYEEYEAIRLSDYEGLTQEQASVIMEVSRPTFTRIYEKARKTIAAAFVEGKAVIIEGGNFYTKDFWYKCSDCRKVNITVRQQNCCNYCKSTNLRTLNANS